MKANQKTFALWLFLLVMAVFFFRAWDMKSQKVIADFNYSKFLRAVELEEVKPETIVFVQDRGEIRGEIKDGLETKYTGTKFLISGNITDKGFEVLQANAPKEAVGGMITFHKTGEDLAALQVQPTAVAVILKAFGRLGI